MTVPKNDSQPELGVSMSQSYQNIDPDKTSYNIYLQFMEDFSYVYFTGPENLNRWWKHWLKNSKLQGKVKYTFPQLKLIICYLKSIQPEKKLI